MSKYIKKNEIDEEVWIGWTHIICKSCEKLFPWHDFKNEMLDVPLDYKYYCPECESKGFKNFIKLTSKQKKEERHINAFLKEKNITDKLTQKEFRKRVKNYSGKCLKYENILRQAIEVVSYKTADEN